MLAMIKPESPLDEQLITAVLNSRIEETKELIKKGAHTEAEDFSDKTTLSIAICNQNLEMMRVLLEHGALVNAHPISGKSPLHVAMLFSGIDIAVLLLNAGANLEAKDWYGRTPLLELVEHCTNPALIDVLIEYKVNINAQDNEYNTALHLAAKYSHARNTEKLIYGKCLVYSINIHGKIPLHLVPLHLPDSPAVIAILIEANSDVNHKDNQKKSPLDLALEDFHKHPLRSNASLKTMLTTVSPREVQHIIPFMLCITKLKTEMLHFPRDIGYKIAKLLIPAVINGKVAFAKQHLPLEAETELRKTIIHSFYKAYGK